MSGERPYTEREVEILVRGVRKFARARRVRGPMGKLGRRVQRFFQARRVRRSGEGPSSTPSS